MSDATTAPAPPPKRLPPGKHKLSREEVRENQLRRLSAAAAEALQEHGYGQITTTAVARRAGVSTATLYRYFDDLWACLLGAYEVGAERLRERIELGCAAAGDGAEERASAGIAAALELLAAEPALAYLLSVEPPVGAGELWEARQQLVTRLATMLRDVRPGPESGEREERLVSGALALVGSRARGRGAWGAGDLASVLAEMLLRR